MQPLVSVLITTYNAEDFILETLESILTQTYNPIEIIIVDDGSNDNTRNRLKPYFNKIVYHYQKNIGTYGALNVAYSLTKGKYIAIQDHDDISMPYRIAEEVDVLERNPYCCFVYSHAIFIDQQGKQIGEWNIDRNQMNRIDTFRDLYVNGNFIPHSSILHNREYIQEINPYNPELKVCGDFHFTLNQTYKHHVVKIPHPLIKIRKGLGNQVSGDKTALFREEKIVLKAIYKKYKCGINRTTYWKSLSNQYAKEAEFFLDNKQIRKFSQATIMSIFYNPLNKRIYLFLLDRYTYFLCKHLNRNKKVA